MPPLPIGDTISYGPSLVLGASGTELGSNAETNRNGAHALTRAREIIDHYGKPPLDAVERERLNLEGNALSAFN